MAIEEEKTVGDAGHVPSPTGGQGMNTGIGDAINLGWKLAQVIQGRADKFLLNSYEIERIAFARILVRTTDEAFNVTIAAGPLGSIGRRYLVPGVIALASKFKAGQHAFFEAVSQTEIEYEDNEISDGSRGELIGGERLPWIDDGIDNLAPVFARVARARLRNSRSPNFGCHCTRSHGPKRQRELVSRKTLLCWSG